MNAYELAGRLLEKKLYLIQEGVNSSYLEDAANMLRQQADRIAELEKAGYEALRKFAKAYDENKKLKSKLETHANIEPKTYAFDENADKTVWISTPQTKPLSDEEIEELIIANLKTVDSYVMGIYQFARAIEAKVRGQ